MERTQGSGEVQRGVGLTNGRGTEESGFSEVGRSREALEKPSPILGIEPGASMVFWGGVLAYVIGQGFQHSGL